MRRDRLSGRIWLFVAALVAAVFLAYMPCWHGGFLLDDDIHLVRNPILQPGGLAKIWVPGRYISYWPLTFTVYWLEYQLWGLEPLGFHLVNIALHVLAALLVWRVLVRLQMPGAMFAAAIFALHPVAVESVAWIAQPASGSCRWCLRLRFRCSSSSATNGRRSRWLYECAADLRVSFVGIGQGDRDYAAGRIACVCLVAARPN